MSDVAVERPSLALALLNRTIADRDLRDALALHFEPGRTAEGRRWSRGAVRSAALRCRMARGQASRTWIDYCAENAEPKPREETVSHVYINYRETPAVAEPVTPMRWRVLEVLGMGAALTAHCALVALWATSLYVACHKGSGLLFAMDFVMPPAGVLHGAGVLLGVF